MCGAIGRWSIASQLFERSGVWHKTSHCLLEFTIHIQTARIWNPLTGESKMELRGHEHVVEVIAFAPVAAYTAIRELAGIPVRSASYLLIDAN